MDKATILKHLHDMREIQKMNWRTFKDYVREYPESNWPRELVDDTDMNIRVLNYVMEAIRQNDIV